MDKVLDGLMQVKAAATTQLEVVGDATVTSLQGVKRSLQNGTKEVGRFASTLGQMFDVEDLLKSIKRINTPEQCSSRRTSVVHEPIDWSKYPPSAFRRDSRDFSSPFIREDSEEEAKVDDQSRSQEGNSKSQKEEIKEKKGQKFKEQSRSRRFSMTKISRTTTTMRHHEEGQRSRLLSVVQEQKVCLSKESTESTSAVEPMPSSFSQDSYADRNPRKRSSDFNYSPNVNSGQSRFNKDYSYENRRQHSAPLVLASPKRLECRRKSSNGELQNSQSKEKVFAPKKQVDKQDKPRRYSEGKFDDGYSSRQSRSPYTSKRSRRSIRMSNSKDF